VTLNVTPAHRAAIDREHAEYQGHVSRVLSSVAGFESTDPAEVTALIATALDAGLRGTDAERTRKAIVLAAVAIERLSRLERTTP